MLFYCPKIALAKSYLVLAVLLFQLYSNTAQLLGQNVVLNFHQLTSEEGLHEATNEFIFTDQDNITWIGSLDGVFRFDGKNIINYNATSRDKASLAGGDVQSNFFQDGQGNIWFTTAKAINCFRKKEQDFIQVKAAGTEGEEDAEPYAFHLEKERYLWVQEKRLPVFDDFKAIRAAAEEDALGNVVRIFGGYWHPKNLGFEMIENRSLVVSQLIANVNGEVCLLGRRGLLFFNPITEESQYRPFPNWVKSRPKMTKIDDQLLLSTRSSKLLFFDLKNKRFVDEYITAVNLEDQQNIEGIGYITLGQDSTLWISARGKGVYYANLKNTNIFNIFYKNKLEERQITNVHQLRDGTILAIDVDGGVNEFLPTGKKREENQLISGKLPARLKFLELPNGQIWAKSTTGLGRLNAATKDFDWIEETRGESNLARQLDSFRMFRSATNCKYCYFRNTPHPPINFDCKPIH